VHIPAFRLSIRGVDRGLGGCLAGDRAGAFHHPNEFDSTPPCIGPARPMRIASDGRLETAAARARFRSNPAST